MGIMSRYKTEDLEKLILIENLSYEEIGRRYGVSGSAIKKVALRRGIELPQRRRVNENEIFSRHYTKTNKLSSNGIIPNNACKSRISVCLNCGKEFKPYVSTSGKYCCSKCQNDYQYKEYIKKWKNGEVSGSKNIYNVSGHVRRYIFEKYNSCCEKCNGNYVNPYTGKSILQIHHKDGDCLNNKEENLQLLCQNCHAMTENFGSRNKNGNKQRTAYFKKDKKHSKKL